MKKIKEMTPEEYTKIIDKGMYDYIANGGDMWNFEKATKEYIFSLFDETVPYEQKKRLQDKAVIAIKNKENLPFGIRLVKCIWHNYK